MAIRWTRCSCRPIVKHPKQPFLTSPHARRWVRSLLQYSLLGFCLLLLVLWLGVEYEERRIKKVPDTSYLYDTPKVCGLSQSDDLIDIQTYETAQAAQNDTTFVAHCGDCGQCSNPHDVDIYDDTKNSLFETTVQCAKRGLIFGRRTASNCMEDRVGFTEGCNECWVENIMCDLRYCIFTCLWHGLFSSASNADSTSDDPQELNRCTLCDEKRCGPAFVECAGANRRRTGILSDIERDQDTEVCQTVKSEWWNDESLQKQWYDQNPDVKEIDTGEHLLLRH